MSKRTTSPDVIAPITPQAAAESALENLIYNTYGDLRLIESRRDEALRHIRMEATSLSKSYATIADNAKDVTNPSFLDLSLSAGTQARLKTASDNYQIQTDLLVNQRRLLKRLLACTTVPWPDQITHAASL